MDSLSGDIPSLARANFRDINIDLNANVVVNLFHSLKELIICCFPLMEPGHWAGPPGKAYPDGQMPAGLPVPSHY